MRLMKMFWCGRLFATWERPKMKAHSTLGLQLPMGYCTVQCTKVTMGIVKDWYNPHREAPSALRSAASHLPDHDPRVSIQTHHIYPLTHRVHPISARKISVPPPLHRQTQAQRPSWRRRIRQHLTSRAEVVRCVTAQYGRRAACTARHR